VFAPLALSSFLISAGEQSIVVSGVARMAAPHVALAAYGIALSLSIVSEAPIIMLLTTSVALVKDRQSFTLVRRFTVGLGCGLVAANTLLYWSPLYDLVVVPAIGLPPDVAAAAHQALRVMLLWPLAIGWRKFHQGILITLRRTRAIGFGTVIRLLTAALVTGAGAVLFHPPGALLGGVALITGIVVESAVITWWTVPLLGSTLLRAPAQPTPLTYRSLWTFHAPLIVTSFFRVLLQPVIGAGITRAALPELSLAAWPVANGANALLVSPSAALPEVVIALRHDAGETRAVKRFGVGVGAASTLVFLIVCATPLASWYFSLLLGVPADVRRLATVALLWMAPIPFLTALQSLLRGTLAIERRTPAIRTAMATNVFVIGVVLVIGVVTGVTSGALLAAAGSSLALAVEVLLLVFAVRQVYLARSEVVPWRKM
jgi:Na+-driven multidrug efflux pump